jgi:transposase
MTCWRRLRDWQAARVWSGLHRVLLDRLGRANAIDWESCSLDSASVPAKRGGELTGPNPADRRGPGSKRHALVDAKGIPLALELTAANVHDSTMLEPVLDAVLPIRQCAGRPRKRPAKLHADMGYDYPRCHRACRKRRIFPRIARRGVESGECLGRHRWVAERTLAWFARFRWLAIRYEREPTSSRRSTGSHRPDLPRLRPPVVLLDTVVGLPWRCPAGRLSTMPRSGGGAGIIRPAERLRCRTALGFYQ